MARLLKALESSVTVDIAICTIFDNDLKVLLTKRTLEPFKSHWAIPGRFVDFTENKSLEETAVSALAEKTGLSSIYIEQLKTYGEPDRDPRRKIITVVYFALVPYSFIEGQKINEDNQWFSLRGGLPAQIAFDHAQILKDLLNRLIGKISYSEIAFSLVPKQFTWLELQKVYEIVLGKKLLAPNFRRKVKSQYELNHLKKIKKNKKAGRPSTYISYIRTKILL